MYCNKCGFQNPDNSAFCQKCGNQMISHSSDNRAPLQTPLQAPLSPSEVSKVQKRKKPVILIIILSVLILAVIAAGCIFFMMNTKTAKSSYDEQIDLGYSLINDGKYEEAIIAFDEAIEIDEKKPKAYYGKTEAMAHDENMNGEVVDEIVEVIDTGYKKSGDAGLIDHMENVAVIIEENGFTEEADLMREEQEQKAKEILDKDVEKKEASKEVTSQSAIGVFSSVVDYNGKTYSGFDNGNSIHVGDSGRTTKLCIYNDYIYYYHTNPGHVFGENSKAESGDLAIWRTDLDGNNKVCIGFGGDIGTLTSTPILIDNKIYMSVNSYDGMPDNERGWHTWVGNMSMGDIFESHGRYYLSTDGDESYEPQLDAKYILTGNEKYLIYDVNDPLDWDPPYDENFVIYNINTGEYSTIATPGLIVGKAYILGETIYYNAQSPLNYGKLESYKYNIKSKEQTKISNRPLTYINGDGYYADGNSLYSIDLTTLETSLVVNYNNVEYFDIENVTPENVYISYVDQNSMINLLQINRNTQDTKTIGSYKLYQ